MAELGDKVVDIVTGQNGIVLGKTVYLFGCVHVCVQPQEVKDGKAAESIWVDESRVTVLAAGAIKAPDNVANRAGCCGDPPKMTR